MLGVAALVWGIVGSTGWRQDAAWAFLPPLIGILAIVWLAPRLPAWPWLTWVGRNTTPIYVVHATAQIVLSSWLAGNNVVLSPTALTLTMFAVGLGAGLLFCAPWFSWLFSLPQRAASRR